MVEGDQRPGVWVGRQHAVEPGGLVLDPAVGVEADEAGALVVDVVDGLFEAGHPVFGKRELGLPVDGQAALVIVLSERLVL